MIELDFGEWTGLDLRRDPRRPALAGLGSHRSIARIPGGETMREVQRRVVEAMMELREAHPDESIVMVSHGDVIRAALMFALAMPIDFYGRIEVATASISTLRIDAHGIRVVAINERLLPTPSTPGR